MQRGEEEGLKGLNGPPSGPHWLRSYFAQPPSNYNAMDALGYNIGIHVHGG